MRKMYLIEHYAINRKNGVWSLIGYSRVDYRVKNLVMKSVKKQGYQYNRSEKAYILETDPFEFCAWQAFNGEAGYSTAGKRLWQEVEEQNKKTA